MKRLSLVAIVALFIGCGGSSNSDTSSSNFRLHILHVNDTHSHLEPTKIKVKINGEKTYVYTGGYAKIANYVKNVKKNDNHAIFLHAGDAVQGTLYYTIFNGDADAEALNKMSINTMVLGNHEFDKGADSTIKFISKLNFPIVDANVKFENNETLVKPYEILNIDGEKVAIVGETVDSSKISSPGPTITFLDYVETAQSAINELEKKGINKIIFLTHIGYDKDKWLANEVHGIDVIVGGHSHTLLGKFDNLDLSTDGEYPTVVENNNSKTLIITAWKWGKVIGDINVTFDKNGNVISYEGTPILLVSDKFLRKNKDGEKVEVNESVKQQIVDFINKQKNIKIEKEDSEVASVINTYKPKVDELMTKTIGYATTDLIHVRLPGKKDEESGKVLPHGSMVAPLVALGMYEKANENNLNVDFTIQNAGGVRHSINEGNITYGDIKTLLPFGNTLVTLQMKGSDIKDMLEKAIDRAYINETNTGAFPYLGNAKITIDKNKSLGNRIVEFKVKENGKWVDLDLNKTYTIGTNSYMAGGGDHYDELVEKAFNKYDTGFVDNETFIEYVKKHTPIKPLEEEELPITVK